MTTIDSSAAKRHPLDCKPGEIRLVERLEQQRRKQHEIAELLETRPEAGIDECRPLQPDADDDEQEDRQDALEDV